MGTEKVSPEEIFSTAVEIEDLAKRKTYLDSACGQDSELRAKVEALIKADAEAGSFMGLPDVDVTLDTAPVIEGPGTVIGRYKLLEQIGEGGFGVVYMAEQTEPISRRVALKVIKLGMDTKAVIARFEAERQVLAMMDHPNIAKVFDAGSTETGRPYFVMELVKGIPITEYCDRNNLETKQRLELFVDVCKAVQHAHEKGIIHRDIKPSNVLITLHDGKAVPKVIDFGIAKATAQRLTEKTLFTRFAQMIGTPEYMSPEQAEFSGLDIDARSDVYSLGVLLYQLLIGVTPFDAEKLREAGYNEMQRIIREDDPDKPSTRLSALGDALADVAKRRKVSPESLQKLLRGDLDLIIMKTLEKDRTRRYERAIELAADVERHLSNKPVVAAPPSMGYRLRKFIRRNRVAVITISLIAAALIVGVISTTVTFLSSESLTGTVVQPTPNYRLVLDEETAGVPVRECDFSPDGDRIVFRSEGNLYITDQTAPSIRSILDLDPWLEYVGKWPRWSPDGRLIAYAVTQEPPSGADARFVNTIFVLNPDDGTSRQVGPDVTEQWPIGSVFWTPDSQNLTYRNSNGLRTLTLNGDEVRLITMRDSDDYSIQELSHSPNGRWLTFSRSKEDGLGTDLCVLPAKGGKQRRITSLPGESHWPTWAPDGRRLYFVSGTEDTSNIWKLPMDPETGLAIGEPQQVTFFKNTVVLDPKVLGDGSRIGLSMYKRNTSIQIADSSSPQEARPLVHSGSYLPQLSPDGQTVYYVSAISGEEGIYAISRQGDEPRRLTKCIPLKETDYWPNRTFDISDDGRTLAYCAKIGNKQGLYTLPTTGGKATLLVQLAQAKETVPQWSPDSSQLAYSDANDLYVISAVGGEARKLAHIEQGCWEFDSIRWSPDGGSIAAFALSSCDSPDSKDVFVVSVSDGQMRQLASADELKLGLEWHPEGDRLTYQVTRPDSEIHQVYLDGREPTLLFNAPGAWDHSGVWAPDGHRFFFVALIQEEGFSGLSMFVYDEPSGKITQLSEPGEVGIPCFSGDGTTIAWWATKKTNIQAWIMEDFLSESADDR